MRTLRESKGFTLIELMIVVVIIGILAAIAIPKFTSVSDTAKQAEAGPILKQICSLAEAEMLKDNNWPAGIAAIPGWEEPATSRFDFTVSGGGETPTTAVATPDATSGGEGLQTVSMNCSTKATTSAEAEDE